MDLIKKDRNTTKRLEPAPGVLYIVGTPIGNICDFSPRAQSLLKTVSLIACEDTRHSGKLLKKFGIKTPLISFHQHNTKSRVLKFIELLNNQESIALISDAGLPLISDPGEELVLAAKREDHEVICIPGPCAATTALISSGLPCKRFCFEGFLPIKKKDREATLNQISQEERTIIIYEAPHRLIRLLTELKIFCGADRTLNIAREITKKHEESIGTTVQEAINHFKDKTPQGEFTLVIAGCETKTSREIDTKTLIKKMQSLISEGISARDASRQIAIETGYSRRNLYALIHKLYK